jgi:tetratricopeptide (TPR) repeat protein
MTRALLVAALAAAIAMPAVVCPSMAYAQDEDKKKKGDMDFEPDEVAKSGPASKTLERALKLYDKGDYYSTSIELYKVLNGETQDDEGNKQRAEFFLGKTLYQMKFYAASLSIFDAIVQKGGAHRYHGITLKWLAALSKVLPESAGILEKIGKYAREDLEDPALDTVRPELYFLLGRHFYGQGNFDQSIELFQSVPRESEFYLEAKFLEGVTYVRKYEGAPAIEAFKEILVVAEEPELRKKYKQDKWQDMQELANLSMGRVFYSTKQFDTSIKYFEKIPQESPMWLESIFDASWAYFMKKGNSKALGNIHTLTAPYFENEFYPEGVVLKAVIYYNYCRYDRASEAVAEFNQLYPPLRDELSKIVKKSEDDNAAFYQFVKKIRNDDSGLPEQVQRLAKTALQDKELEKTFDFVDELDRELKQHEGADRAWKTTAVAGQVLQELSVQKSLAEAEAGRLARERLIRLVNELTELRRDVLKVKNEILNAKIGQKRAELQKQEIFGDNKQESIIVDDEHQTWSFNGEYWKDELGFYRFRISSKCARK